MDKHPLQQAVVQVYFCQMVQLLNNTNKVRLTSGKRNWLGRRIAAACFGFALVHFTIDFTHTNYDAAVFDIAIAVVLLAAYVMNRLQYYGASKILGLGLVNVALVFYSCIEPKDAGVFLYFFPLAAISSALFGPTERIYRAFFIGLPFLLLSVLIFTDFKLLGDIPYHSADNLRLFFIVNSICSGIILIMCLDFIIQINETSENQLQKLAQEVRAKNDDLVKTNAELDRFLYSTSHDLRSPLSSIKGLIHVARYDTTDKKVLGYFNMMIDRVERLEHFIKDIIDYSKNARTESRHEAFDFNHLIGDVVENLKYLEGADRIAFKQHVAIHDNVVADKSRLNIVLTNLVANAIKYHDLRKAEQWINVAVTNSNGTIKVQVSDNGTGIAQEHQEKIFDMFYRGTLQSSGSGLGLYIVKQAVEKMQGTITVLSDPGQGSSFLVTIPVS